MTVSPSLSRLRFSDSLEAEDTVAFGLPLGRLALVGSGLATSIGLLQSPLPTPVRLLGSVLLVTTSAGLGWGRWEGVSLARWLWFGARFQHRLLRARGRRRGWRPAGPDRTGPDLAARRPGPPARLGP